MQFSICEIHQMADFKVTKEVWNHGLDSGGSADVGPRFQDLEGKNSDHFPFAGISAAKRKCHCTFQANKLQHCSRVLFLCFLLNALKSGRKLKKDSSLFARSWQGRFQLEHSFASSTP